MTSTFDTLTASQAENAARTLRLALPEVAARSTTELVNAMSAAQLALTSTRSTRSIEVTATHGNGTFQRPSSRLDKDECELMVALEIISRAKWDDGVNTQDFEVTCYPSGITYSLKVCTFEEALKGALEYLKKRTPEEAHAFIHSQCVKFLEQAIGQPEFESIMKLAEEQFDDGFCLIRNNPRLNGSTHYKMVSYMHQLGKQIVADGDFVFSSEPAIQMHMAALFINDYSVTFS